MARKKKTILPGIVEQIKQAYNEFDGTVKVLTGKPLKQHFANSIRDFTDNTLEKAPEPLDNYTVLGVTPTTPPEKVKQVYLALIKVYHEAGLSPNGIKMREINNAYESICRERGWSK